MAVTSSNRILSFSSSTPGTTTAVSVTGLQAGENIIGMDIRPADGMLYALTNAARIYTINTTTGAASQRATLSADPTDTSAPYTGLQGATYGVDFNSVVDRLRVVSNTGQNLRINVDLGTVITDPTLVTGTQATPSSVSNIGAVSYTQAFSSACRTSASLLDTTNGVFYTGNLLTGQLQNVASLGVTPNSTLSGYQVATDNNGNDTAFALLRVNGTYNLYSVNLTTGAASNPQALGGLNAGETVTGLAMAIPTTQPTQAAGQMLGLSVSNRLISFNTNVPNKLCTSTAITGLAANDSLIGIDTRPANNQLYGIGTSGAIYTINKTTGAATTSVSMNGATLSGQNFGLNFNAIANAIRVVSNTGQNLVVNVDTGATTTSTSLNASTLSPATAAVSAISYTNTFAGTGTIKAYVLDAANDRLLGLGLTSGSAGNGDLSAVGTATSLGVGDIGPIGQLKINPINNMTFAAVNIAQAQISQLIQINLQTGTATSAGPIGGNEAVRGITNTNVPNATVVAATAGNQLVTFSPTNPGTFTATTAITGLQGGETLVGLDYRPSNGLLYGLTNAGRNYVVNATTGAATLLSTSTATLSGNNFGPDFNPVLDLVRQVSDQNQNLVINVDNGQTTTQSNLNRPAFSITAAAYINSVPGANATTPTTLYDIDTNNNVLMIQSPQNNGTLMPVGPLGVTVTGVNGFEIQGSNQTGGTAAGFAALQTSATATPGLYNINLSTGAATLIGTIGVPTGSSITGLSASPSTTAPASNTPIFAVVVSSNGTQSLATFNFGTPGTLTSNNTITGLGTGETILGADFRPSTGQLYALTRTAIYTLNTANGQATQVATLSGTTLTGTNFGVDVSPPADAIRVVSDAGQNVAITFAGVVNSTAQGVQPLNMPAPSIFSLGYTQNYAGTTTTRAIAIDSATSAVYQINPTSAGTLVPIGGFTPGVTFTALGESDIVGGDDGLSLAALQPTGATQSTLYRVNPFNGQITAIGAIGPTGTATVSALAIQLK
jgi:hypothetical protein